MSVDIYGVTRQLLIKIPFVKTLQNKWWKISPRLLERYESISDSVFLAYLVKVKKLQKLPLPEGINSNRYHIFLIEKNGKKYLHKYLRKKRYIKFKNDGYLLYQLKDDAVFERYRKTLISASSLPDLGAYVCEVTTVHRDGSYESPYVEGINLQDLEVRLATGEVTLNEISDVRLKIITALDEVISALHKYHGETGHLAGDWYPNNLVFNPETGMVMNVDSEGFFSYWNGGNHNFGDVVDTLEQTKKILRNKSELEQPNEDVSLKRLLRIINYTKVSKSSYSAQEFDAAYHSIKLGDQYFRGQRDNAVRLKNLDYDFRDKAVLDVGCNIGGMLHAIADQIGSGVGLDYDYRCINAANSIKKFNGMEHLEFFTFDIDKEDISMIESYLLGKNVDISFFLSVAMWVGKWRDVIVLLSKISDNLLFESNGSEKQQDEQVRFINRVYKSVSQVAAESVDDPGQKKRKLFLCHN